MNVIFGVTYMYDAIAKAWVANGYPSLPISTSLLVGPNTIVSSTTIIGGS